MSAQVIPIPRRRQVPRRALLLVLGYVAGFGLLVRDYVVQSRFPAPAALTPGSKVGPVELAAEP